MHKATWATPKTKIIPVKISIAIGLTEVLPAWLGWKAANDPMQPNKTITEPPIIHMTNRTVTQALPELLTGAVGVLEETAWVCGRTVSPTCQSAANLSGLLR